MKVISDLAPGDVVYLGSSTPSIVIYVSAPLESGQSITFMGNGWGPSFQHQNGRKIINVMLFSPNGIGPLIPFYSDVTLDTEPQPLWELFKYLASESARCSRSLLTLAVACARLCTRVSRRGEKAVTSS